MTQIFRRRAFAALAAAHLIYMGALAAPAPAAAMQILDAADHAELVAEISARGVNRIALAGDRIAKVVRAPDGFAVEHDAGSGDLYLRPAVPPAGTHPTEANARDPVTLFIGTEKGFTYRLTLMPVERDSAQVLIRNTDTTRTGPLAAAKPAGGAHVAALVRLVRAVARRKLLTGHAIEAGSGRSVAGLTLIETWRGPRYRALVLEADTLPTASADGAEAGLAGTIADALAVGRLAALWLAAPGTGPSGGRFAVAVVDNAARGGLR